MTRDDIKANGVCPNAVPPNCGDYSMWQPYPPSKPRPGGQSMSTIGGREYPVLRLLSLWPGASLEPPGRCTPTKPNLILNAWQKAGKRLDRNHRILPETRTGTFDTE